MNELHKVHLDSSYITNLTMTDLSTYFGLHTHHIPTTEMMSALKAASQVMEDMANQSCPPSFYLSSVDPGVGKTSVLIHSIRNILKSPHHDHISILICVSRLDEIKKIAEQAKLKPHQYAAFTRNPEVNALVLGIEEVNQARVLFTTQQMITSRCDGKSFKDASEFHYKNQPRDVRVWDEAFLPGEALTINRVAMLSLASKWLESYPALGELVETLSGKLRELKDGDTVTIPDLQEALGVTKEKMLSTLPSDSNKLLQAATTLWLLSGKKVSIKEDEGYQQSKRQTALSYREHLPEDLAPMLILDASGRVRQTYELWDNSDRKNLVQLTQARKTYSNLTVHLWKRGGGKSAFRSRTSQNELIKGICNTIKSKPNEEFLIVHHKEEDKMDVKSAIMKSLKGHNPARVSFTSWGNHKASNEWTHITNIILAGTLFYPNSYYEALGRLSANLKPGHSFTKEIYNQTCLGEHKDGILQAGCRAAIRRSVNGDCPPSNLYIIASAKSGIPKALEEVFPKHKSKAWTPIRRSLSSKQDQALAYLDQQFTRKPEAFIKFATLRKYLNDMDVANFNKRIRKDERFESELAERGIIEVQSDTSVRRVGFMLAGSYYGF